MTKDRNTGPNAGLSIFLKYWALFALLGGFNVYLYVNRGNILFLVVALVCGAVFVGWFFFYLYYVRGKG
ncbi:MAG TPA: hypothetical protein VE262_08880 [Blastocatellia bacterium]|nr:hypothetical protein [Blastocatellia bacterium]